MSIGFTPEMLPSSRNQPPKNPWNGTLTTLSMGQVFRMKPLSLRNRPVLLVLCIIAHFFSETLCAAEPANDASELPPGVRSMEAPGIHNMFALGTNFFSGSAPEGDVAFSALEKLGVKTIITVDGTKPAVELAHKHGMRYVHLPHGYDGIPPETEARLIKAAEDLPGPIFIHCHHGKHRGPAATAIICMSELGWTAAEADHWLHFAGTATNYVGLFDAPRRFQKPTPEQLKALPSDFPEISQSSGLTDSMVGVDEQWDHLKAIRAAGYKAQKIILVCFR